MPEITIFDIFKPEQATLPINVLVLFFNTPLTVLGYVKVYYLGSVIVSTIL